MEPRPGCVVVTGFGPFRQHLVNSSWEAVKGRQRPVQRKRSTEKHREPAPSDPSKGSTVRLFTQVPPGVVAGLCRTENGVSNNTLHLPTGKSSYTFYGCESRAVELDYNHDQRGAQELSKLGLGSDEQVELQTLQLPVDYREVRQRVMRIWEDLQPKLTVHVGLDSGAKAVVLEQCGKNRGYREADVRGFRPELGTCLPGGPEVIESRVSMKAISRRVAVEGVEVAFSRDAGRYVCDYTYYLSLHHGNGCAALIHVPPLSPWLPASLLGKALQVIVQEMLEAGKEALAPSLVPRNLDLGGSSPGKAIGGLLL